MAKGKNEQLENQFEIKIFVQFYGVLNMWYYQSQRDDSEVIEKLEELADQFPTRGFDNYYGRLRQQGYSWSRNKVLRIYRLMKLGLRRKHKRRLPTRVKEPLLVPNAPNQTWSVAAAARIL